MNLTLHGRRPPIRSGCHAVALAAAWVFALTSSIATAQTAPDAGSVLQQIERQRSVPLPPQTPPQFAPPAPLQSLGGATVTVTAFRFAGNRLLTPAQLAPAVKGFLNRPLSFSELQNAAIAVAAAYREAGWVVRAYLPQQDIAGGTVTIQIVEAIFGALRLDMQGARVSEARLRGIVQAAQPAGTPVNGDALDRALLLIDDLPGVAATGRLAEGRNQGETDLVLSVAAAPRASGDVSADNTGARSTGSARVVATVGLNSPFGLGDQASATLLHSRGSDYARAAYSLPVGSRGWRLGANVSHLKYRVVTPEFSQLDAHGDSTAAGVEATYPLIRSRLANLYVTLAYDAKRFDNLSAGVTSTRYKLRTSSVGLNGNVFDNRGGGGASSGSLMLVQGRVDLGGSPNEAADAASTRTAGSFTKLRYALARQQVVTESVSLYASLSGQAAGKNLDSSEKFYLGGAGGVRAYPASEGSGAEGQLLNLEARVRLPANVNLSGFYDWGSVHVNKHNAITGAALPNRYTLQGVGVSLGWMANFGLSVKATLAHRIGNNPNPTATGSDQDGTLDKNRFWLQASQPF